MLDRRSRSARVRRVAHLKKLVKSQIVKRVRSLRKKSQSPTNFYRRTRFMLKTMRVMTKNRSSRSALHKSDLCRIKETTRHRLPSDHLDKFRNQ